jgi:enamine deaminase RidA (YjgF/YER057c/UK114 family)
MDMTMKMILMLISMSQIINVNGQDRPQLVTLSNPPGLAVAKGYSHFAKIDLGTCDMIIISGQVALDSAGNLVGKGDMERQTEQVFANIRKVIVANGGDMNSLVKLQYYVKDVNEIQKIRNVRDRYINLKTPPTSTLVEVSNLFRADLLIEIESTAVIPKTSSR